VDPALIASADTSTGGSTVWVSLAIVLFFVLLGGFFAAAEIALISLRESRVAVLRETRPKKGERVARLVSNPNRLLAAVQVGVTLAGFISAGFGASQIAPSVEPLLVTLGIGPALAGGMAFFGVTLFIAYLSLVLGELVPKRIALQRAEGTAMLLAGPVDVLATIFKPFIWLLSVSTDLVVRALGGDPKAGREQMTSEELRGLVANHAEFTMTERELIDDVFAAGTRQLREVMIPRTEVEFLAGDTPVFRAVEQVAALPYSRYPVVGDSADDVLGFVHVRDLLAPSLRARGIRLGDITREVARLPGSKLVLPAMAEMREAGMHLAIVVDEYGGTDGIVTLEDLVEEVVGDIRDEFDAESATHAPAAPTLTGAREVEGLMNLEDFAESTGIELPEGPYETVAGWLVATVGALPSLGDAAQFEGSRFEVLALDGRRIDRILVTPGLPASVGGLGREPVGESDR
jgi:putative hemolysin